MKNFRITKIQYHDIHFQQRSMYFIVEQQSRFWFFRWWSPICKTELDYDGNSYSVPLKFRSLDDAETWINNYNRGTVKPETFTTTVMKQIKCDE